MTMRRYLQQRSQPRLNIIPMIDVMMFLLVFFVLIVFHSIPDSGINVRLPAASHTDHLPPRNIIVNVNSTHTVSVGGRTMSTGGLTSYLRTQQTNKQLNVILVGDRSLPLQNLIGVMSAIRAAGFKNVGIAVRGQKAG